MKETAYTKATVEPPRESQRRYPELDGLRGAAILLVVGHHYQVLPYLGGVILFFVLSGFLLGGILMSKRGAPNYYKAFYARRACRILPLYLLSVLAFFSILAGLPHSWPFGPPLDWLFDAPLPLWSYLAFVQNFVMVYRNELGAAWLNPTWSLAVEEQFCLMLPILVALVPPKKLPHVLFVGMLVAPLFRMATYDEGGPNMASLVLFPARADALFLGVLCAWVLREPWALAFLQRHRKTLYCALAFLAAGPCWYLGLLTPWLLPEPPGWGVNALTNSSFALFYGCALLVAVTEGRGLLSLVMCLKPLRLLAPIAFGVFLFHMPVGAAVGGLAFGEAVWPETNTWPVLTAKLGSFAAVVALATASWVFFESRIVAWGRSFRYERVSGGAQGAPARSSQGTAVRAEGESHNVSLTPSAGSQNRRAEGRSPMPPEQQEALAPCVKP